MRSQLIDASHVSGDSDSGGRDGFSNHVMDDDKFLEEFKVRPCQWYYDEFRECSRYLSRFHQRFVFGKTLDCSGWKNDYEDCLAFRDNADFHSLKRVLDNESKRQQKRKDSLTANNVWKYRQTPPEDWNKPLPQWLIERTKGSYLEEGSIHHIESSFLSVYYNDECIEWPVVDGCFVAFVQLVSENNTILLTVNNDFKKCKLKFNLLFHRTNATKLIKLVYVLCKDSKGDIFDGGKYQAPLIYDSSILSAIEKISFLALVIQCFFASTSLNRQSLNFETKSEIQPFVHILLVEKTNEELWLLDQQQLWRYIASELIKSELFSPHCKFLTLCSFTRCEIEIDNGHNLKYEKLLKLSRGSVALGGGGLALIGTPFLFTLPNGVRDMFLKLCQNEKFDSETERGVLDLCAATIGTCIHELGHTLDLGHSKFGVMSTEYASIKHFFRVQKLKCKWWNRSSFLILSHHKWFRENCEEQETNTEIMMVLL
ncbi:hypothetical protein B4U79_09260 [Dinothrombium tinctorium]|uniref:Zinc metalloproteinase-like protein n=1 Tax=Dinothrombium tinctorium TaxID=1965070 RepID=A0A443RI05_9ACAR|nr:hypothetical protein B4U79_09260 [Dinothrombium tinctorium]